MWISKTGRTKVTTTPKLNVFPPTTEAFEDNVKHAHLLTCSWNRRRLLNGDPPDMDLSNFGRNKDGHNKSLPPATVPSSVQPVPPEILQLIRYGDQACSSGADMLVPN